MLERAVVCAALQLVFVVAATGTFFPMDFYSSTLRTQELLRTHRQVVRIMTKYKGALEETLALLHNYLSESEVSSIREPWVTYGDPLRTFRLVKRTSRDLDTIVESIRTLRSLDPLLEVDNLREGNLLPTAEDMVGITRALLRIQRSYYLDAEEMARGKLTDKVQVPVNLTAADCLHIAQEAEELHAEKNGKLIQVEAPLWYRAGLNSIDESSPYLYLKEDLQLGLDNVQSSKDTYPFLPDDYTDSRYNDTILSVEISSKTKIEELRLKRRLCRGEKLRVPSLDVNCSCHLKRGPHPYLIIRPLKVEVLNPDPFVALFHDILGNKEIAEIIAKGSIFLSPSTVVGAGDLSVKSSIRVSATSWLHDFQLPSFRKSIEALTGLRASVVAREAEELQVLNYGVGGHYSTHHDFFESEKSDNFSVTSGNRVATLMIYLSDVEEGGATVFPHLGLTIYPKKGSAAFWWNLKHTGEHDRRTLHAGCPVIFGAKWVCNKWFRAYPQMFNFPCGLRIESGPNAF